MGLIDVLHCNDKDSDSVSPFTPVSERVQVIFAANGACELKGRAALPSGSQTLHVITRFSEGSGRDACPPWGRTSPAAGTTEQSIPTAEGHSGLRASARECPLHDRGVLVPLVTFLCGLVFVAGTLTQNEMVFKRLHLGTVSYGADTMDEIQSHLRNPYTQVSPLGLGGRLRECQAWRAGLSLSHPLISKSPNVFVLKHSVLIYKSGDSFWANFK